MLTYRRATPEDAVDLAGRLREADLCELRAGGRDNPVDALLAAFNHPEPNVHVAVDEQGIPQIIFGIHPSGDPLIGLAWMVGSDELKKHWIQVLRDTKPMIDKVRGNHQILANAVHAENKVHLRWLRWAGFTFLRKLEVNGHEFYEFAKLYRSENF